MSARAKRGLAFIVVGLLALVSACRGETTVVIPTRVAGADTPSGPTATPVARATLPPTWTPTFTRTSSPTPTTTFTPTLTLTPTITDTPTVTLTPMPTPTNTPAGDAYVSGASGANLRRGPGQRFDPPLALLPPDTGLLLVGRSSDGQWYEVQTFEGGLTGWVYSHLVTVRRDVSSIPVTWVNTPVPTPIPPPVQIASNPPPAGGSTAAAPPGDNQQPNPPPAAPPPANVSQRTRQIFMTGQGRGNRANVFSKVGDSITVTQPFFQALGTGHYDLGPYSYLQATIDFFAAGAPNSFTRPSYAASDAFNAAAVLASMWANPSACMANETPLACEYRVARPSVAVILLGSVDVQLYDVNAFRNHMEEITGYTISQGIVPVLTTFPTGPGYHPAEAESFNAAIREIAAREQIPLVELRAPASGMPRSGVEPDQYHLTHREDYFVSFNGDESQLAFTLREFLTLQALDTLRRGIPMG